MGDVDGDRLCCSRHGAVFDTRTGQVARRYPTRVVGDTGEVQVGESLDAPRGVVLAGVDG